MTEKKQQTTLLLILFTLLVITKTLTATEPLTQNIKTHLDTPIHTNNNPFPTIPNTWTLNKKINKKIYIPLKATSSEQETKPFDLHEKVIQFLQQENCNTLIITGEPGSGKTTYLQHLHKHLTTTQQKNNTTILIPLISYTQAIKNNQFLSTLYKNHKIPKNNKLILLLDAYDETELQQPLYNTIQKAQTPHKTICTIRKEYPLQSTKLIPHHPLFQEINIQPFNQQQIQTYLQQITQTPSNPWKNPKQYHFHITKIEKQTPNTITNPLLLHMICHILPTITQKKTATHTFTKTDLYTAYLEYHYQQYNSTHINTPNMQQYQQYAETIASTMLQNNNTLTIPSMNTLPKHILNAIPLKKLNNNTWAFTHKTYLEYYIAQNILHQTSAKDKIQPQSLTLNKQNLNKQPQIIRHLIDITQTNPIFCKQLFTYIEESKKNPDIAIVAANSATILAAADIKLNDLNWQAIRIPGANLNGAFLARTNFSSSNCRNVSLQNTFLADTQWNKTQTEGINFQNHIPLKHTGKITNATLSPQNNKLATATKNNLYIWNTNTPKKLHTCIAHTQNITSITWSPDSSNIATTSHDSTLRIWDSHTGKLLYTQHHHTPYTNTIQWSPNTQHIASIGRKNNINDNNKQPKNNPLIIWQWDKEKKTLTQHKTYPNTSYITTIQWASNTQHIAMATANNTIQILSLQNNNTTTYTQHQNEITTIQWSPNSQTIASTSKNIIHIWKPSTTNLIYSFKRHQNNITTLRWSHDSKYIATGSTDKTLRIWDPNTGKYLQKCTGHTWSITTLSWSHDSKYIATGSADKTIRIWKPHTGQQIHICKGHRWYIRTVSWSSDNTKIISTSDDETARIWNIEHKPPYQTQGHTDTIKAITWSPDSKKIASGSTDNNLHIWDFQTGKRLHKCTIHTQAINDIKWSPNSKYIVTASDDNTISIWNPHTGQPIQTYTEHTSLVTTISISPNSQYILASSADNTISLSNNTTGTSRYKVHSSLVTSVQWSPNNQYIATSSWDNTIHIWKFPPQNNKLQLIYTSKNQKSIINNLHWSSDSQYIASSSWDKTISIIHIQTQPNKQTSFTTHTYYGHTNIVITTQWSPNGKQLASVSADKTLCIWYHPTTKTNKPQHTCKGHTDEITTLAWSPDSTKIATGSHDKTLRIWNPKTGKQLKECKGHTASIKTLSWSHNNQYIASAGDDTTIRIWNPNNAQTLLILGNHQYLTLQNAIFKNSINLSKINKHIIEQHGGIIINHHHQHTSKNQEEHKEDAQNIYNHEDQEECIIL